MLAELLTDWPEQRLKVGRVLQLRWDDGRRGEYRLTSFKSSPRGVMLGFAGVEDISGAETLAGGWVGAPAEELPLPEGEIRQVDLAGMTVIGGDGAEIGVVVDILDGVASDLLVLELNSGGEALVPLAPEICTEIDLAGKRVVIDPPEGLLELEQAGSEQGEERRR